MDVPNFDFSESCLSASELLSEFDLKTSNRKTFNKKLNGRRKEKLSLDNHYDSYVERIKVARQQKKNVNLLVKELEVIKKFRKNKRAYCQSLPTLKKTGVYLLDTLHSLIEYFKTIRDVVGEETLKWLLDLFVTLYNVYRRPEWDSFLLNISSFLLRNFPQKHADYAIAWFKAAFEVAIGQSMMDYKEIILSLFETPYDFFHDELWNNILAFFAKAVALYGALVDAVSIETIDFDSIVKHFTAFKDKYLPDCRDLVEMCFNAYEFVLGNWENIITGSWDKLLLGKDETKIFELEIRELEQAFPLVIANKVIELESTYNLTIQKYHDRLAKAIKTAKSLIVRCSSAQQRMSVSNFIRSLTDKQAELFARIADAPEKEEAYAIKLAGPSSCGKSTMVNLLSKVILNAYDCDPNARGQVVFTNISENFESTILPTHKIICADDVANNKNEKPNYDRILNYVNTVPRPLEKADVKDKGILYPGNSAFIATTNDETIRVFQCSSCPESILRRFHLDVTVRIKSEFQNSFGGLVKMPSPRFDVYELTLKRFSCITYGKGESPKVIWDEIPRSKWNPECRNDFEALCTFVARDIAEHRTAQESAKEGRKALQESKFCPDHLCPTVLCGCKSCTMQIGGFLTTLNTAELWDLRSGLNGTLSGIQNVYRKGLLYRKLYRDRHQVQRILFGLLGSIIVGAFLSHRFAQLLLFCNLALGAEYYRRLVTEVDQEISRRSDQLSSLCIDVREHLRENVRKYFAVGVSILALHQAYKALKPLFSSVSQDKSTFFEPMRDTFSKMIDSPPPGEHCFIQEQDIRDYKEGYSRMPPEMSKISKTTTSEDLQKKVAKCLRFVITKSKGEVFGTVNGIMVASNVIMIPAHAVPYTFPFSIETTTTPGVPSAKTKDQKITENFCSIDRENDVAFVHLLSAPASTSFVDFFPDSLPAFRARSATMLWKSPENEVKVSRGPIREMHEDLKYSGYLEKPGHFYGTRRELTILTLKKERGLKSDLEFNGFGGLCGALYIDTTKALIYGFHVAGYLGSKTGFLTCVTRPQINKALSELKEKSPSLVVHSSGDLRVDTYGLPYTIQNAAPLYMREDGTQKESVVTYRGQVLKNGQKLEERSRTPYVPTPFKGVEKQFGVCKHKPPTKPNDIAKGMKTLNKLTNPVQHYEGDILEKAIQDYKDHTLKAIRDNIEECSEYFRIYTQEEAMDGIGEFGLGGLPNDTSAGFPIQKSKKHCLKRDPMDESLVQVPREFNDNYPIQDEIDRTLNAWSEGYRSESIYKASSKVNELLPSAKATEKVRKFYGSGFANFVASRRVLAGIPRFMRAHWKTTECMVGINPMSKEWDEFHEYLTAYGENNMIAGDFSGFDTRMSAQITGAAANIMLSWYKECGMSDDDLELVRGALSDIIHPNILFQGDLYTFANANPSGNLITVQLNSVSDSLMMRYVYYAMMPRIEEPFAQNVRLGTYGDDNAMSVKKHCKWYTHTACQAEFEKLDVGYTMADKDAKSVPYISIDRISFLKRGFRYEETLGKIVAPIEEDSITKKFYWIKKANESPLLPEEQFAAYLDTSLRESYLHGKAFYQTMMDKFRAIVDENPRLKPHAAFIPYEEMTQLLLPSYREDYVNDNRKLFAESCGVDSDDQRYFDQSVSL
jgi:energy-coupling factor transporter ATP-binding protein EcfA2